MERNYNTEDLWEKGWGIVLQSIEAPFLFYHIQCGIRSGLLDLI